MKKLIVLLAALFLVSCKGDTGPMGPPGEDGLPGSVGQSFEVVVNFNESNKFGEYVEIPTDIEVYESDIVAVYLLWEVDENTDYDVWQPLPASVFFEDGELQYAFDHTVADVQLFLTGDTNLSTIPDDYTQNQIFRVAILPVDYVKAKNINMSNMKEVMQAVDKSKIQRLHID